MTSGQDQDKRHSRKLYVVWGIVLSLLIATGFFCWTVVVPVIQVRSYLTSQKYEYVVDDGERYVGTHGSNSTRRAIHIYLRLPKAIAPSRSKHAAIDLLGYCGPTAIPLLGALLEDENDLYIMAAARSLVRIGPKSIPALLSTLQHGKNVDTRFCALGALAAVQRNPETIRLLLIETLGDDEVGFAAASLLAKRTPKDPAILPALQNALGSKNPRVRALAADAIGYVGKSAVTAVPSLESMLNDRDDRVRASACLAIMQCANRYDNVLPVVLPLLRSKDQQAIRSAICTVLLIGLPARSAKPDLAMISKDKQLHVSLRDSAAEALEKISKAQQDK